MNAVLARAPSPVRLPNPIFLPTSVSKDPSNWHQPLSLRIQSTDPIAENPGLVSNNPTISNVPSCLNTKCSGDLLTDTASPVGIEISDADPTCIIPKLALAQESSIHTSPSTVIVTLTKNNVSLLDFSNPQPVPKVSPEVFVYPLAVAGTQIQERFCVVKDILKRAVDEDNSLRYRTEYINYELKICGNSPQKAFPTVLVICKDDEFFPHLRKLFREPTVRRQYESLRRIPFKLVFWRTKDPTRRKSGSGSASLRTNSRETICGGLIGYEGRFSTLAMVVSVNSCLFGMTVSHLFDLPSARLKGNSLSSQPSLLGGGSQTYDSNEEDNAVDTWFDEVDEIEYEPLDEDERSGEDCSAPARTEFDSMKGKQPDQNNVFDIVDLYTLPGHGVKKLDSFLDWKLFKFVDHTFERPNLIYLGDRPDIPLFIEGFASPRRDLSVEVYLISGIRGTRKGILLPNGSFIGGRPGDQLCRSWNVSLLDGEDILDGECGSLVIDQHTFYAYGHIVASNPLGEGYMVSMKETFEQINKFHGFEDVSFPRANSALFRLMTQYIMKKDHDGAEKIKDIIDTRLQVQKSDGFHTVNAGAPKVEALSRFYPEGPYKDEEDMIQREILRCASIFGSNHPETISILATLGAFLSYQEKFDMAAVFLNQALDTRKHPNRPDNIFALEISQDLADVLIKLGKFDEAKKIQLQALDISIDFWGPTHSVTLYARSQLGIILFMNGEYREAENLLEWVALASSESPSKLETENQISALFYLGQTLSIQSKPLEAVKVFSAAVRLTESAPEKDPLFFIRIMQCLGQEYVNMNNDEQAKAAFQVALQRSEASWGYNDRIVCEILTTLGMGFISIGELDVAEGILRNVMSARINILGAFHPDTMVSMSELGLYLLSRSNFEEAEDLLREVLSMREQVLGSEHLETILSMKNLGLCLQSPTNSNEARARSHEAKILLVEALSRAEKVLGSEHKTTVSINHLLRGIFKLDRGSLGHYSSETRAYSSGGLGNCTKGSETVLEHIERKSYGRIIRRIFGSILSVAKSRKGKRNKLNLEGSTV